MMRSVLDLLTTAMVITICGSDSWGVGPLMTVAVSYAFVWLGFVLPDDLRLIDEYKQQKGLGEH